MTMDTHPTVTSDADFKVLSELVHTVTHAFVENNTNNP